jgi:hypothetical protein
VFVHRPVEGLLIQLANFRRDLFELFIAGEFAPRNRLLARLLNRFISFVALFR